MTVDEFIDWHESHPIPGGFPCLPRQTLEEMVAEGYALELREVGKTKTGAAILAPYVRSPEDTSV